MTGLGWGGPSSSLRQGGGGGELQRGSTGLSGEQLSVVLTAGHLLTLGGSPRGQGSCLLSPSSVCPSDGHCPMSDAEATVSIFPSCCFRGPGAAHHIGHPGPPPLALPWKLD